MIEKKGAFYAGVFIFIIPFLGFPTMWKMILVGIAGFLLIVTSLRFPVPRRVFKNKNKKEIQPVEASEIQEEIMSQVPTKVEPSVNPEIEIIIPKRKRKASTKTISARRISIQE